MTAVSHRLGISSFAFRYAVGTAQFRPPDPLGLPRFIEAARDLGFSRVLLYDNIGSCDFSAATCRDLARRLDQYGLDCELGVRSLTADTLSRYLPLAELLGAQSLRVTVPGADSVAAAVDSARRIFDRDRGRIDRHGVVVAVENHFSLSPDGVERLVESVDHPLVRYICDSTNSICFVEKPEETLARMRGRLYALHLKDYVFRKLEAGYLMDGVALGAGAADIPGLIRQARSYNPDVNIEMEMTMLRPPEMAAEAVVAWEAEQVKQSAGYLFGCLAEKDQKEKGDSNESGLY